MYSPWALLLIISKAPTNTSSSNLLFSISDGFQTRLSYEISLLNFKILFIAEP